MSKIIKTKTIIAYLLFASFLNAKPVKIDEIPQIQSKINQCYELGYVDTAPIEVSNIENKLDQAKQARENRDKKLFNKLVIELKIDLEIVKKRYKVNELNKQLAKVQQQNFNNQKILDELKEQL